MTLPRPRPTLADIDLPPRRRLRDGSRSTASAASASGSSSRSSSVGSSYRGRGGRSVSTFSTLSSSGSEVMPTHTRATRRGAGAGAVGSRRSPRGRPVAVVEPEPESQTQGEDPIWDPPPTRAYDHGATLLDMLDVIDGTHQQPVNTTASSSSSTSTSSPNQNETDADAHQPPNGNSGRRFTAAEKGKGRAPPAETITISDNEDGDDEVIVVTGVKRKVHEVDDDEGEDSEVVEGDMGEGMERKKDGEEMQGDVEEEPERLGEFTCPVCFSEPTQAVMTVCGHVLCAECLHSSLLAAIARNPNPHPHNQPPPPRPKPKSRRAKKTTKIEPQPTTWNIHTLREAWFHQRDLEYTKNARAAGMDEASIEAGREGTPPPDSVGVTMVLKGLWKVEDRYWVIEGECPVCRKGLPGGYGPPGMGIGGVIPLKVRVEGGGK